MKKEAKEILSDYIEKEFFGEFVRMFKEKYNADLPEHVKFEFKITCLKFKEGEPKVLKNLIEDERYDKFCGYADISGELLEE